MKAIHKISHGATYAVLGPIAALVTFIFAGLALALVMHYELPIFFATVIVCAIFCAVGYHAQRWVEESADFTANKVCSVTRATGKFLQELPENALITLVVITLPFAIIKAKIRHYRKK